MYDLVAENIIRIKFIHLDVTSFDSQVAFLREALEFFPRNEVDIYVPGAGILPLPTNIAPEDPTGLTDLKKPPQDLSASCINVNLSGVWVGTMMVARYGMGLHKAQEGGPKPTKSIVLIASLAGYCGAEGSVEYTTTKFGVRGLLRGLRKQLAGLGVRLNAVSPFCEYYILIRAYLANLEASSVANCRQMSILQ